MNKRVISIVVLLSFALTGCGSTANVGVANSSVKELSNMQALNTESTLTSKDYKLSYAEKQDMLYEQVSARSLLDFAHLTKCTDNDIEQVRNYMNLVDDQLVGKTPTDVYDIEGNQQLPIDECFTNYLLCMFEQTPYYWQRTKTTIKGVDPDSQAMIVDVTYKTIDFRKDISVDSSIVKGEPNYETKLKNRFEKWLAICDLRLNNPESTNLPVWQTAFKEYYGDPQDIIDEQRTGTLTHTIYETGNQTTHSGLLTAGAQSGGTITVRYILVPNYVLGVNLGIKCKHMYVTDYKLTKDPTPANLFKEEGYQTITDTIYSLLYSYFQAMDESDFMGLYALSKDFKTMDKYYTDLFNTTYTKHEGFTIALFDIQGTKIQCGVQVSTKSRAKGSNMTFPIYIDKYLCNLELVDNALKVVDMTLVERKLVGEPAIESDLAEVQGFSGTIDLSVEDKLAIEKLIGYFGKLQLIADTTSDDFAACVDITLPQSQLNELKEHMTSMFSSLNGSERKVIFLQNYMQGTSNFAQVKCRELYQDAKLNVTEATSTYGFINTGGQWRINSYDILSTVKLDSQNLNTTGSLYLLGPGDSVAYTSQVKSTQTEDLDAVADVSVSFEHEEYKPTIKAGLREQGNLLYTADNMNNPELFNKVVESYSLGDSIGDYEKWSGNFDIAISTIEGSGYDFASDLVESLNTIKLTQLVGMANALNKAELYITDESDFVQLRSDYDAMHELETSYLKGKISEFKGDEYTELKTILEQIIKNTKTINGLL